MKHAALGFRAHSGWATVVAVAGSPRSPEVVDRRRVEFADSKQPYHAAADMELKVAEKFLSHCAKRTDELALRALRAVLADVRKRYEVSCCGILLGSGRPIPALASTLASHALIHTAEGEFFRQALIHAGEKCGLSVLGLRERELCTPELVRRVTELGRPLGPPWRQDEKHAALAAWMALKRGSRAAVS